MISPLLAVLFQAHSLARRLPIALSYVLKLAWKFINNGLTSAPVVILAQKIIIFRAQFEECPIFCVSSNVSSA
jgi:hypothetical protein